MCVASISTRSSSVTDKAPTLVSIIVHSISMQRDTQDGQNIPASRRSTIREGVPIPIPILLQLAPNWSRKQCAKLHGTHLVFLTYIMASFNLMCFAKSLATTASLVWKVRKALECVNSNFLVVQVSQHTW